MDSSKVGYRGRHYAYGDKTRRIPHPFLSPPLAYNGVMSEMFTPTPDVPNQQDTKVKEKADAVTVAIALSKQWKQEKIEAEREMYHEGGFRITPDVEQDILKYAENLVICEDDEMFAEKVKVVNSPYEVEHKKALLLMIKGLEEQKSPPLAVKKEVIALLVPRPAGMPELIKAYKHLAWEFASRDADDGILYYVFHREWEYAEEANKRIKKNKEFSGPFHDPIFEDASDFSDFTAGEESYMGESLLWEIEKEFDEALNFEDERQYAQTAAFLEFIKAVMDRGADHLFFLTLRDVLKKKVTGDSGMLLKMRAEDIINNEDDSGLQLELVQGEILSRSRMKDSLINNERFFKYERNKIAVLKSDGLYVSDSLKEGDIEALERLEKCEEKLKSLIRQRNKIAEESDFIFHVLEDEDYGEGSTVASDKERAVEETKAITSKILQDRALNDFEKYFKKREDVSKKTRKELVDQIDEISEHIENLESEISSVRDERRSFLPIITQYELHKMDPHGPTMKGSLGNEEEGKQIFLDYRYLLTPAMRNKIEKLFSYPIQRLPASEQFQFLNYIKAKKEGEIKKVQDFVAKYGENGFRTFLSLEYGRELGDDIVALGEKLPKAEASRLFEKYGELVDAAEQAESYTGQLAGTRSPEMVVDVRENLLRKGRELLVLFATKVKSAKEGKYDRAVEDLEQELSLLRGDAALFAATFKELAKTGEQLNLAEIKDVEFTQGISPESFSEVDKERMKEFYRINYSAYPEFQKMLLESFERVLKEPTNRFYVLRYKGEIEGFYRLGMSPQDRIYFGAFNMNPKYAGSGLGEALMQQSLDVQARDSVIEANCIADKSVASNYIERGFIGTHTKQVNEPHLMYITRHDTKKDIFISKNLASEEIMRTCETATGYICKKVPLESVTETDLALLNERSADGTRHVLTRYIRDKKSQNSYLVFEKTTDAAIEEFSRPQKPLLLGVRD